MSKVSFSGKMLQMGPLVKTNFEIPVGAVSQSVTDKPAHVYTNAPSDIPRTGIETVQE